jgi:hypothetical protein
MVGFGEIRALVASNMLAMTHTLASVGTGALSAANDWDTQGGGSTPQDHMVLLRLTAV